MPKGKNAQLKLPKEMTPYTRLSVAQTSVIYNIPDWKLWTAIRKKHLPCQRLLNGRIYLTVADIEAALTASNSKEAGHE